MLSYCICGTGSRTRYAIFFLPRTRLPLFFANYRTLLMFWRLNLHVVSVLTIALCILDDGRNEIYSQNLL